MWRGGEVFSPSESRGKDVGAREYTLTIPDPPRVYSPHDVKRIRQQRGMTQAIFARLMNVSVKSVEGWEAGTKKPGPASRRLLQIVENDRAAKIVEEIATGQS